MSIGPRVVVAVALQKVDRAPHAKAGAQRHNEGLQNTDRTVEKCHRFVLLKVGGRSNPPRPEMVAFVAENTGFPRLYAAFPGLAHRMDACHCQSGDSSIPGRPEGDRPYAPAVRWPGSGSGEQAGQQGDQGDADEGDTAARHQLLHALALSSLRIKKQREVKNFCRHYPAGPRRIGLAQSSGKSTLPTKE